jgi:hypothetical protein
MEEVQMPRITRNHSKSTLEGARAVLASAQWRAEEIRGPQVNLPTALGPAIAAPVHQTPIRGGVPLVVDGEVVGAIGVSAGNEDQDSDVARAGVAAIEKV